jgi:hypothetical protein
LPVSDAQHVGIGGIGANLVVTGRQGAAVHGEVEWHGCFVALARWSCAIAQPVVMKVTATKWAIAVMRFMTVSFSMYLLQVP